MSVMKADGKHVPGLVDQTGKRNEKARQVGEKGGRQKRECD